MKRITRRRSMITAREDRDFASNPLTQDPERFAIIENYFTRIPTLLSAA